MRTFLLESFLLLMLLAFGDRFLEFLLVQMEF
nr:MAG TPA: hypothetical protein [Caudoviricetes sp.]